MTKKSAITIAFLVGLTTIALPAAPASASTPQCTTKKVIWDDRGDAQITVPVSTSGSDNCWLAKGDISSAVGALQAALKYCNGWQFGSLAVDNNYGPATKAAVTDFQQGYADAGDPISVDGVYGPQSKAYMAFPDVGSQYCDYAP